VPSWYLLWFPRLSWVLLYAVEYWLEVPLYTPGNEPVLTIFNVLAYEQRCVSYRSESSVIVLVFLLNTFGNLVVIAFWLSHWLSQMRVALCMESIVFHRPSTICHSNHESKRWWTGLSTILGTSFMNWSMFQGCCLFTSSDPKCQTL